MIFSENGFAEPSVAQIKSACEVSLRTLYKHFSSKEEMIVAALNHRHNRYLDFLSDGVTNSGIEAIQHIFQRLELWMGLYAPNGCMSVNAVAAFPKNKSICNAVKIHKEQTRQFLAAYSLREELASELLILHEGVSSLWPLIGHEAFIAAQISILKLLKED